MEVVELFQREVLFSYGVRKGYQHQLIPFPYPHEVRERHRGPNPSICSLLLYPYLAILFR